MHKYFLGQSGKFYEDRESCVAPFRHHFCWGLEKRSITVDFQMVIMSKSHFLCWENWNQIEKWPFVIVTISRVTICEINPLAPRKMARTSNYLPELLSFLVYCWIPSFAGVEQEYPDRSIPCFQGTLLILTFSKFTCADCSDLTILL